MGEQDVRVGRDTRRQVEPRGKRVTGRARKRYDLANARHGGSLHRTRMPECSPKRPLPPRQTGARLRLPAV